MKLTSTSCPMTIIDHHTYAAIHAQINKCKEFLTHNIKEIGFYRYYKPIYMSGKNKINIEIPTKGSSTTQMEHHIRIHYNAQNVSNLYIIMFIQTTVFFS